MQLKARKIFYQKKMTNSATFPKRHGKIFCLTIENTFIYTYKCLDCEKFF